MFYHLCESEVCLCHSKIIDLHPKTMSENKCQKRKLTPSSNISSVITDPPAKLLRTGSASANQSQQHSMNSDKSVTEVAQEHLNYQVMCSRLDNIHRKKLFLLVGQHLKKYPAHGCELRKLQWELMKSQMFYDCHQMLEDHKKDHPVRVPPNSPKKQTKLSPFRSRTEVEKDLKSPEFKVDLEPLRLAFEESAPKYSAERRNKALDDTREMLRGIITGPPTKDPTLKQACKELLHSMKDLKASTPLPGNTTHGNGE